MLTPVGFALLHDTIFVGGRNLSDRLDARHTAGLVMGYDEDKKNLYVTWNNETMRVPEPNIRGFVEGSAKDRKVVQMAHPMVAGVASAQVETPMGHVQKGPGFGKDGRVKL